MTDVQEILQLFTIAFSAAQVNYEGISDEESLWTPDKGGNHLNWILGHIVMSREVILEMLGQARLLTPEQARPYKRGIKPEQMTDLLPFKQLVELHTRGQELLKTALEGMTAKRLEACDPESKNEWLRQPLYKTLLFLHFHETYHVGQIGLLRRLLGKEGAIQ
jgi:uncharacterized damage-inducible protein DinB